METNRVGPRGRLPRYAVAAGATLAGGAAPLAAQIVYFDNSHSLTSGVWDIDNNGNRDFNVVTNGGIGMWGYGTGTFPYGPNFNFNKLASISNGNKTIQPVSAGNVIGPGLNFVGAGNTFQNITQGNNPVSPVTSGNQYFAFRFRIAGATHYGWVNLTVTPGVGSGVTIHYWAYSSVANATILAGAIPEPATTAAGLSLLALGAAGVARYKRRKHAA